MLHCFAPAIRTRQHISLSASLVRGVLVGARFGTTTVGIGQGLVDWSTSCDHAKIAIDEQVSQKFRNSSSDDDASGEQGSVRQTESESYLPSWERTEDLPRQADNSVLRPSRPITLLSIKNSTCSKNMIYLPWRRALLANYTYSQNNVSPYQQTKYN